MLKHFFNIMILLTALIANAADNSGNNPVMRQESDYPCRRLTAPFEFRGQLDDWRRNGAIPLFLNGPGNVMIPDWKGPEDVDVTVYLLHDDRALYFGAVVHDVNPGYQEKSSALYRGNGFQIAFDPLDDTILPGYDGNDIELGLGKLNDGRTAVHCWVGGEAMKSGPHGDIKAQITAIGENTLLYEMAIPWASLKPFNPATRDSFGFDVLYNTSRNGERRGWLHWTPGIGEEKLAFMFRNVRLVPAGKGIGEAVITTNAAQYSSGDHAMVSLYLPTDQTGGGKAVFTVAAEGKVIDSATVNFQAQPGGVVVRFPYAIGRLRGNGLEVSAQAAYPGGETRLTVELLNLSVAVLEADANRLAARLREFRAKLKQAQANGIPVDYPQVAAAVSDVTLKYRGNDLKKPELLQKFSLLPKIRRQFQTIDAMLSRAETELAALQNTPKICRKVPTPPMENLSIRDGVFYSGNEPVMLIGPHSWWGVYSDLPLVSELGFNMVGGTLIAGDVTPAPGKIRKGFAQGIDKSLKELKKLNLAYDFLISPHPLPDGWKKEHPEITSYEGSGWVKSSLYIPATRTMIETMWSALLPIVRDNPNLVSLNLVNEWCFSDGIKTIHPTMLNRFHAAMRTQYGTITELNRHWKSNYADFTAIDPLQLKRGTIGGFYDYEKFRNNEALENLKFLRNLAKKYAPGIPCQVKTIAVTDLNPEQYTPVGVERELRGKIMEISGSDCAGPMELDYFRSVVPDKPAADTEFHVSQNTTPAEMATDCWSAILHGEGMRQYYVWSPNYSAELLAAGAVLHNPASLEALGRTVLDIRRLAPEIAAFQRAVPDAEVGMLYSPASLYCAREYPAALRQCYARLSRLDAPLRFVSELQLAEGNFAKLKLLVIPGASVLEPATVTALNRFTSGGGKILVQSVKNFTDPYGRPLAKFEFEPAGSDTDWNRTLDSARITRPIRNNNGAFVELRTVDTADGILFYAINYGAPFDFAPRTATGQTLSGAVELISGQAVTFPLRLETRKPLLFKVKK